MHDIEEAVNSLRKSQSIMSSDPLGNRISTFPTNFCISVVSQECHMPNSIPGMVRKLDLDTSQLGQSLHLSGTIIPKD